MRQLRPPLAFLPDLQLVGSLGSPTATDSRGARRCRRRPTDGLPALRKLQNRSVCNWAVPPTTTARCAVSCRLTRVDPESRRPGPPRGVVSPRGRQAAPGLHAASSSACRCATGPTIRSAAWRSSSSPMPTRRSAPVLTGHADGVITINIAEADDAEREKRRTRAARAVSDAARTHAARERALLLGSPDRAGRPELDEFRSALRRRARRLRRGAAARTTSTAPPADWQERFVSAYASAHPWEDWAETWAHYLHMIDTLETAAACGLSLRPRRRDEPSLPKVPAAGVAAAGRVRSPDRQLVSADLRVEQPESRARARRRLSVRALGPGGRQAAVRARRRQVSSLKAQVSSLKAEGMQA